MHFKFPAWKETAAQISVTNLRPSQDDSRLFLGLVSGAGIRV